MQPFQQKELHQLKAKVRSSFIFGDIFEKKRKTPTKPSTKATAVSSLTEIAKASTSKITSPKIDFINDTKAQIQKFLIIKERLEKK